MIVLIAQELETMNSNDAAKWLLRWLLASFHGHALDEEIIMNATFTQCRDSRTNRTQNATYARSTHGLVTISSHQAFNIHLLALLKLGPFKPMYPTLHTKIKFSRAVLTRFERSFFSLKLHFIAKVRWQEDKPHVHSLPQWLNLNPTLSSLTLTLQLTTEISRGTGVSTNHWFWDEMLT